MRRTAVILLTASAALGLAPGASARVERDLLGAVGRAELSKGRGHAVVSASDGVLVAKVRKGRIVVVDLPRGAKTNVSFSGCRERRNPAPRKTVCIGQNIRASVVNGSWQTVLKGRGINASAAAKGSLRLRGPRGTFKIDDGPWRKWPRVFRSFKLG